MYTQLYTGINRFKVIKAKGHVLQFYEEKKTYPIYKQHIVPHWKSRYFMNFEFPRLGTVVAS